MVETRAAKRADPKASMSADQTAGWKEPHLAGSMAAQKAGLTADLTAQS